jgi:hypothetical protein
VSRRSAEVLALRQQRLLMRSQALRQRLASDAAAWQAPLRWADGAVAVWTWLRGHPEAPLAALAVVLLLRPRRALRWGLRLWSGWRLLQRLQERTSAWR